MTKDELVTNVAKKANMPKTHVNKVIRATLDEITKALKKGDKVSFVGFGTFTTARRAARTGRNPQT
ncbi:integration host factor subunit alpha, partial [bacterium]